MIGHIFGKGYPTPRFHLFDEDSPTMEASLQHSILDANVFIQQKIAEWPASGGGQLPDPQQ